MCYNDFIKIFYFQNIHDRLVWRCMNGVTETMAQMKGVVNYGSVTNR